MKKLSKKIFAATAFGALCMAGTAQAITVPLNIAGVSSPVAVLDLSPGNAIAVNAQVLQNTGGSFPLYYQAKLGNYLDTDGNAIGSSGLGTSYEVTAVFGFYEFGIATPNPLSNGIQGVTSNFTFDASKPSFVNLYRDTLKDSNNLAGTGFTNGALILAGHVVADGFSSTFTSTNGITNGTLPSGSPRPYSNLDSSPNGNQWTTSNSVGGNQLSVTGSGGTNLTVKVDAFNQDFTYFLDAIDLLSFELLTNTSNNLPFNQVDPSKRFYNGGPVGNPGSYFSSVGTMGTVNGSAVGAGGSNVMFQADANASFEAAVPEPSTFVLSGLGFLLAGGLMRRRRNS